MSELTEFLLARIAEDESTFPHYEHCGVRYWECDCSFPDQWERECVAKRRIVEALDQDPWCIDGGYVYIDTTLYGLASVYADHPDYREEWRP